MNSVQPIKKLKHDISPIIFLNPKPKNMNKSIFPLLITGMISATLLILSFISLNNYYASYGIDIKQWMGLDEWIALNFDGFLDHLYKVLIVGTFTWLILSYRKKEVEQLRKLTSGQERKTLYILSSIVYFFSVSSLIYLMVYNPVSPSSLPILDAAIIITIIVLLFMAIMARTIFTVAQATISEGHLILVICLVTLFLNAAALSDKNRLRIRNSEVITKVEFTLGSIDSVRYLGRSNEFYFFKKIDEHQTIVIERSKVKNIEMINGDGAKFSVY